jgi:hypothetical protein
MIRFSKGPWVIVGLAVMLLSGCSALEESYDQITGNTYKPTACPRFSVLADAADLVRFQDGAGRDLTDVRFESKISGVDVKCGYDLEEDHSGSLEVDVSVFFDTTQGPANNADRVVLPYFLAILDSERNVLERKAFDFTVGFSGNAVQSSLQDEPVHFILPLKPGETGANFEIYSGFTLSKEEADYNRRRRAR